MKKILFLILALVTVQLGAQDVAHYKKIVKKLSSAKYQGRGYAEDGANKARQISFFIPSTLLSKSANRKTAVPLQSFLCYT